MKRLIFALLIGAASVSLAAAQVKYLTYSNDRYFFSVEFPSNLLKIQPPPTNSDGRTFTSPDRQVEMRAWAGFNVTDLSLEDKYHEDAGSSGAAVTYRKMMKDGFAFSGYIGDDVFYQKTLHHKFPDADVFYTFTIRYPRSQKVKFDAIVKRIAASFKFDPHADV